MNSPALHHRLHLLFFATIACIIGIWWQTTSFAWWGLALACIPCGLLCYYTKNHKFLFLAITTSCAFALGALRMHTTEKSHQATEKELGNHKQWDLVGRVIDINAIEHARHKQRVTLALTHYKPTAQASWITTATTVECYLYNKNETLRYDDVILMHNIPLRPANNGDYRRYLMRNGVTGAAFIPRLQEQLLERPTFSIFRWLYEQRAKLYTQLAIKMSHPTFSLFSTLFLGNTSPAKNTLHNARTNFSTWGIAHYLARSGLHLIIIIFLWSILLRFLPISFSLQQLFLIFLVSLYTIFSWASVSYVRALITFFLYKFCSLRRLHNQLIHILTLTTLIVIIYNPLHIFFLDFQLSFGLTAALALYNFFSATSSKHLAKA